MRNIFKKTACTALALFMLAPSLRTFASVALGDDLQKKETQLHEGTTYVQEAFYSNTYQDLRQEKYVVYEPNAAVKPVISYGDYILERVTTKTAAERLEKDGDVRVIAGMNGDFFGVSSGMPLGSIVTDGVLRVGLQENYAIGFYADGTAVLGEPKLQMHAEILKAEREPTEEIEATTLLIEPLPGEVPAQETAEQSTLTPTPFDITAVNCVRYSYGGIYLYSRDFNSRQTVGTNEEGVDVVCTVTDGTLAIGKSVTLRVEQVLENAKDTAVPEGCLVLSANNKAGDTFTAPLRALQTGDELCVSVSAESEKWNEVKEMMGALYLLVQDGKVQSGLEATQAPRTAIGQRADGSIIFYTIDGRQSGLSIGAGTNQVAQRLVELGCVTALGLDGGGSTTMLCTYPAGEEASVVNSPSDGSSRKVTNSVFLVASAEKTGEAAHISLTAEEQTVLPGGKTNLFCRVLDSNFMPMEGTPEITVSDGMIEAGNVFAASQEAGTVTVTAAYGEITQTTTIEVVAAPDSVTVYANGIVMGDTLCLSGEESVALTTTALYRHLPLRTDNLPIEWISDGTAGTLQGNVFTANKNGGSGTLTLQCGTMKKQITVRAAAKPLCTLQNFEAAFEPVSAADGTLQLSYHTARDAVRFGTASGKLSYALTAENGAALPVSYGIPSGYDSVSLWVQGDGNAVTLALQTDCGAAAAQSIAFTGWKQLSFALPEGAKTVTGLCLAGAVGTGGTIYLDQVLAAYDGKQDTTPPQITGSVQNGKVQCTVSDAVDGGNVTLSLTANGTPLTYAYDAGTGLLTAAVKSTAPLCRVTLTACDASGNLSRWSGDERAETVENPFDDTKNHWAADYIAWLKEAGITTGDGNGNYHPDDTITREEFATLLCRYLGTDAGTASVRFADDGKISDWAKSGVYALYAKGIIQGSEEGGKLYFHPQEKISRQEAAAMLARLFAQGYTAEEKQFSDAKKIAAWASEAVSLLSSLGVLTGDSDGGFHPEDSLTRAQTAAVLYRMQ